MYESFPGGFMIDSGTPIVFANMIIGISNTHH